MIKKLFILMLLLLSTVAGVFPLVRISLTNAQWDPILDRSGVLGLPGSTLSTSITSPPDVVSVRIFTDTGWNLTVERQDLNWSSELLLELRVSSTDNTFNRVGSTFTPGFLTIPTNPVQFATGPAMRNGTLGIQYQISNINAFTGAGQHTTTIIYTVTAN